MKQPNFTTPDSKRGVSPVIGVILMVAITVILAAVIASFVLGFGGSVNENAQAGVTVDDDTHNVALTSLGDSTVGVKCSSDTPNNVTESVGGEINCSAGDSVIAFTEDNETETAVRTDI